MGPLRDWIKWLLLIIITLGIYSFWVIPRLTKWVVENTDFDPTFIPSSASPTATVNVNVAVPPSTV